MKLFFGLFLIGLGIPLACNTLPKPSAPRLSSSLSSSETTHSAPKTDSVNVEIFIIHLDPQQQELLHQLWQEVDEQSLPPQLRRGLLEEGFRAGILGNLISPALAKILNITSQGKTYSSWEFQEQSITEAARSNVMRSVRTLLPDMHAVVKVFDEQDTLPELILFKQENGQISAQTLLGASGVFNVSAKSNKDGSAQLQIVPLVEYGESKPQLRAMAGMFVYDVSKPRHSFESLTVSQRLLPGQWFIMGATTPDAAGAGKSFFVRKSMMLDQRLLAIRISGIASAAIPTTPPLSAAAPRGTETIMPERY